MKARVSFNWVFVGFGNGITIACLVIPGDQSWLSFVGLGIILIALAFILLK